MQLYKFQHYVFFGIKYENKNLKSKKLKNEIFKINFDNAIAYYINIK